MAHFRLQLILLLHERFRWLAFFLVLAVLGVGYLWAVRPRLDELLLINRVDVASKHDQLAARERQRDQLKRDAATLAALQATDAEALRHFLPDTIDLVGLTQSIGSVARDAGVVIHSLKIQPSTALSSSRAETDGALAQTTVSVEVGGMDYLHFRRFVTALEHASRAYTLVNLSFAPKTDAYVFNLVAWNQVAQKNGP